MRPRQTGAWRASGTGQGSQQNFQRAGEVAGGGAGGRRMERQRQEQGLRGSQGLSRGRGVGRMEVRPPGIRPALAVTQTTPEPPQTPRSPERGRGSGGAGRAEWGRGVAPVAPALSDVIGPTLRGPRHLFSIPPRPLGCARPGAGAARAVDVTAKFAALRAPRVAAATVGRRRGSACEHRGAAADRSRAARLRHAAPRWGPKAVWSSRARAKRSARPAAGLRFPLGQRESVGPRSGVQRARPGGHRHEGRDYRSQLSAAHGAPRPGSLECPPRDRARDAGSLSGDPRREAARGRR